MLQLLSILIALIAGHSCRRLPVSQTVLNNLLNISILIILFVMGYDFGSNTASISSEALQLFEEVATFTSILFLFNFTSTYLFARWKYRVQHDQYKITKNHSYFLKYVLISSKYLFYVIAGIVVGYFMKWNLIYLSAIISTMLFTILFIIGYQLNQQGVSLKNTLANKLGIAISIIIVVSSLCAGILSAKILNLDMKIGLILSSGFGWYTLSGILSGQLISHHVGTASFFIDFIREIIAILLIPTFGRKYPIPLIAYSGATASDFTLPIIKVHVGDEGVPVAVTSGMILTVLVPILMPLLGLL